MAAAQRPGHRHRLCRQPGSPRNHSDTVQPGPDCVADESALRPRPVCASPATAAAPQNYTYGYSIVTRTPASRIHRSIFPMDTPYQQTFEGGNVDLRVPYIGYSSESESYTAAGISAYNALAGPRGKAHEPRRAGRRSPTPTRIRPTSRAPWACSTTATTRLTCAPATATPTSTART